MKKYSIEKGARYLSILAIVVGIILIVLAFLPKNLITQIIMIGIINFLIVSGISALVRMKKIKN